MKYFFNIILYIATLLQVSAQVPGYMGQKWAVFGSTALSPALYSRYLEYDTKDYSSVGRYGVNARFDISTDYTLSKVVSMGASFKHITTKLPYAHYTTLINDPDYERASYFGDIKLSANFGSFYFKFFPFNKKGAIAPVGKYNKIEFIFGKINGSTGKWVSEFYDPDIYIFNGSPNDLNYTDFESLNYQKEDRVYGFMYSFGNAWAFTDKLIFDFSTQFGWLFLSSLVPEFSGTVNAGERSYEYEHDALERVQGTFAMNFSFGLGYFLF